LNKHICFIIPDISIGGAERVVSILANYLDSKNFKISFVLLYSRVDFSLNPNIQVITPTFEVKRNIIDIFKVIKYYRKSIRAINPNVIFSFLEFYNEIVMLSLLGIKKKIFLFDRNTPFLKSQFFLQKILKKKLYPKANGVIVQTQIAANNILKNKLNSNVLVLPNPISKFNHQWKPNNNKIIISVGSIEKQKNHRFLIDVFDSINDKEWKLIIIGSGSLLPELKEYVKNLEIGCNIFFLGSRDDVKEKLLDSTIFAFPSLWEGFPNALLEALVLGVPCISNNCNTGPSELIKDNENGFLVEENNFSEFKNKLMLLMNNDNLRTQFSRKNIYLYNNYSVEEISSIMLEFIFK
jgi:glycosyltransferase involved in cell wall biosynthesis